MGKGFTKIENNITPNVQKILSKNASECVRFKRTQKFFIEPVIHLQGDRKFRVRLKMTYSGASDSGFCRNLLHIWGIKHCCVVCFSLQLIII